MNDFTEAEFYSFFGNLENIETVIYDMFFEKNGWTFKRC
jgi:hypothetical protein